MTSKGKGGLVEEVFTPAGKQYVVKCRVVLSNLRQALALRSIITSFETSAVRRDKGNGKGSVSSTPV